jgi:hypothetical protein
LTVEPAALYLQLTQLIAEIPILGGTGPITPEINRWLGRAVYLVTEVGNGIDPVTLTVASDGLNAPGTMREMYAQQIQAVVFRALAFAEARAPTAARGGFIGIQQHLDALQAVGRILGEARRDVLIVDPYMDSKVFTDFAQTAPPTVAIRLLTDSFYTKAEAVRPAMLRWIQQFGADRPIEVRLSTPRALHDRLIFADRTSAWSLSQSLKDIAARSPASAQRLDAEVAAMKVGFYEQVWAAATPVT